MANFSTHVTGAAACAGLLSTLFLKAGHVGVSDALLLTVSATIGGILPDIDLKYSHPSKIVFTLIGTLAALLWMFSSKNNLAVLEIWVIGLGIFLAIRYPVWAIFHKFTVHRGAIHSIAAAVMFAVLAAVTADRVFATTAFLAWLIALFVFAGFVFHLVLDELYSVDFLGYRIKKSFGSALKLIDRQYLGGTCAILFVTLFAWFYTPDSSDLTRRLADAKSIEQLFDNLLPAYVSNRLTVQPLHTGDATR